MSDAPIDLGHLEKYVSGDLALRDEILTIFYDQAESLIERFDVNASDEDWKDTAHAFKGASRGVGAWALGDLCEHAEDLIGEMDGKIEARQKVLVDIEAASRFVMDDVIRLRDAA